MTLHIPPLVTGHTQFNYRLLVAHKPKNENEMKSLDKTLHAIDPLDLHSRIALICHSTQPIRHLVLLNSLTGTRNEREKFAAPLQIGFRKFELKFSKNGGEMVLAPNLRAVPSPLYPKPHGPFFVVLDVLQRKWIYESQELFVKSAFYPKLMEIYMKYVVGFPKLFPLAYTPQNKDKMVPLVQLCQDIVSDSAMVATMITEMQKTAIAEEREKKPAQKRQRTTTAAAKSETKQVKKKAKPASENKTSKEAVEIFSTTERKQDARKRAIQLYDDIRNGKMYHAEKISMKGDIEKNEEGSWQITVESENSSSVEQEEAEKEEGQDLSEEEDEEEDDDDDKW